MSLSAPTGNNPQAQLPNPQSQQAMQLMGGGQGQQGRPNFQQLEQTIAQQLFGGRLGTPSTPQYGLWGTPPGGSVPNQINSQMPGNVGGTFGGPNNIANTMQPTARPQMPVGGTFGGPNNIAFSMPMLSSASQPR